MQPKGRRHACVMERRVHNALSMDAKTRLIIARLSQFYLLAVSASVWPGLRKLKSKKLENLPDEENPTQS